MQKRLADLDAAPQANDAGQPPLPPPSGAPAAAPSVDEFDLKNFKCEDDWAAAVLPTLKPEHKAHVDRLVQKFVFGHADCSRCSSPQSAAKVQGGCSECSFFKVVRYWRNQEMQGQKLEGYTTGVGIAKAMLASSVELTGAKLQPYKSGDSPISAEVCRSP